MLDLGIARALPDVEPMDKESLGNIGRIIFVIGTVIAHQRVEAIDAARQKDDTSSLAGGAPTPAASGTFDDRSGRRHPAPAHPPGMRRQQPLDQHWTGLPLDAYPCFAVYRGEGETCGGQCVRGV